ncbi:flavin monoamine oxidase family protein [Aquimarina litoralis]|uniref:flavin monoamine oxidase family protein n=1 Tax=Aquimarina litoralis TaxID=584605 RepID=UPI001C5612F5|nr:FAD-dependent oxidoreductase [Aquimarina litoralis]MBW1298042.1 NAD(P)-binding protein [Aquimarina litoralis]
MKTDVLIIGAGLTGLLLAYRLKKSGISVKVVEANYRVGGRIHTISSKNETPIEMGATWFGVHHQNLIQLLEELELPIFEQFMEGTALFEPLSTAPPQKIQLPTNQQPSYRIQHGTSTIIHKLSSCLNTSELLLNEQVTRIEHRNDELIITTNLTSYKSKKVVSTLPPRLLLNTIQIQPQLPNELVDIANKTHTWMGESVKFGISYEKPFWKENQYSGTVFSNVGPITELYDHSNVENSRFALKGFLQNGMSEYSKEQRISKVFNQLEKLFGNDALNYLAYEDVLWKNEPYTSFPSSEFIFPHQNNGHPYYQKGYFDNSLFIGGTETSPEHGGYMEGAIKSAQYLSKKIIPLL